MLLKKRVLELKNKGFTISEIAKKTGCSKSGVSYHFHPSKKREIIRKKNERRKNKRVILDKRGELTVPEKKVDWKCAEAYCHLKLIEMGYSTFVPFTGGGEVDIIATKDGVVHRIQVKSVSVRRGMESFNINVQRRRTGRKKGLYKEIDWFLIYDGTNLYKVPFEEGMRNISLRYKEARNGQGKKVKMAYDFLFS